MKRLAVIEWVLIAALCVALGGCTMIDSAKKAANHYGLMDGKPNFSKKTVKEIIPIALALGVDPMLINYTAMLTPAAKEKYGLTIPDTPTTTPAMAGVVKAEIETMIRQIIQQELKAALEGNP